MTKSLIYERVVGIGPENVGLRLFQAKNGLLLERFLAEGDRAMFVQVLPITSLTEFDAFRCADPYRLQLSAVYDEAMKKSIAAIKIYV